MPVAAAFVSYRQAGKQHNMPSKPEREAVQLSHETAAYSRLVQITRKNSTGRISKHIRVLCKSVLHWQQAGHHRWLLQLSSRSHTTPYLQV